MLAVCPQEGYSPSLSFGVKICTVGMKFLPARTDEKNLKRHHVTYRSHSGLTLLLVFYQNFSTDSEIDTFQGEEFEQSRLTGGWVVCGVVCGQQPVPGAACLSSPQTGGLETLPGVASGAAGAPGLAGAVGSAPVQALVTLPATSSCQSRFNADIFITSQGLAPWQGVTEAEC